MTDIQKDIENLCYKYNVKGVFLFADDKGIGMVKVGMETHEVVGILEIYKYEFMKRKEV